MKYIRTKDGKIHISYSDYQGFEKLWVCKKRNTLADFYYVRRSNIVKQSDDLKELCDCFVYGKCDYMELEEAQQEKEWYEQNLQQDGQPIYGAIWTDKGLIYVARMNEKGDLELL